MRPYPKCAGCPQEFKGWCTDEDGFPGCIRDDKEYEEEDDDE